MNWQVFSRWCETKVIPTIALTGVKSVVVLERATYHTVLDEEDKRQSTSWNKTRLTESIKCWGKAPADWAATWNYAKTKVQLLDYARKIHPSPKCKIQKMADKFYTATFSIKILFLPVGHPELNPIEMVWCCVKCTVASRNMQFQFNAVDKLTREQINVVTDPQFKKCNKHGKQEEDKYRKMNQDITD